MRRGSILDWSGLSVALAGMGWGQYAIRRNPDNWLGTGVFLAAAAAAAALLGRRPPSPPEAGREQLPPAPERELWGRSGVLLLGGALLVIGGSFVLARDWRTWFFYGWAALAAGAGLMSLSLRRLEPRTGGGGWTWIEAAALLGIFALGTFLRFYHYGEFPDPYTTHAIEEQQTGLGGYEILTRGARPWEFFVDHFMAALALALAREPSFLVIRVPFTVFSALTIIPVHLLLRQLVRPPAALAGTFLFSVSSWNIIYSRCAHNIFLTNFFVVIVLAVLVHFGRTRRLPALPWAGLLSGYTLYSYAGYRGTSLFAIVFLGSALAADAWRAWRGRRAMHPEHAPLPRDFAALGTVVFLVAATATPLVFQLRSRPGYYFEAASRSLANREYYSSDPLAFLRQRLERARAASRIFMHAGDDSLTFNAPREPMLDPFTSVCFTTGLFLALFFPRRGYNGFLLFMFAALMLGSTVFVQNLDVRRLQGITVFVAAFAALFLDGLTMRVQRRRHSASFVLVLGLALVAASFTCWWNYDVYFRKMATNPRVREAFKNQYTTLIRYGRDQGRDRKLLLLSLIDRFFDPHYYYRSHYSWLIDDVMRGRDLGDVHDFFPPAPLPPGDRTLTAVIQRPYEEEAIRALLEQSYPGTRCANFLEPDNPYVAFVACDLPPGVAPRPFTTTLTGRYWYGTRARGKPIVTRQEPFIGYAVVPRRCARRACYAEWNGTLEIPARGKYEFVTDLRGKTTAGFLLDGQPLPKGPLRLAAGAHALRGHAQLPAERGAGVRLSRIRNGQRQVVTFLRPKRG